MLWQDRCSNSSFRVVLLILVVSCLPIRLLAETSDVPDITVSHASEARLSGQAVFADGTPAANMRIRFEGAATEGREPVLSEEGTTDREGRFTVGVADAGIADGVALLEEVVERRPPPPSLGLASSSGARRWSTPVQGTGLGSPIRLVFENRGAISVVIAPAKQYPSAFEAALTRAAGPHGDGLLIHPPDEPGKMNGDGGMIVYRGLEPGAYTVEVRALAGPGWRWSKEVTVPEDTPARAQIVRFDLPEPSYGKICARVVSEEDGTPVPRAEGFLTGIRFHKGIDVRDGLVEVSDVPPGEYRLRVSGVAWPPSGEAIVVEGGETIDLGDIPVRQTRRPFFDSANVVQAEGRLLYEDGTPATGATVLVSDPVDEDGGFTTWVRKGTSIVGVDLTHAEGWWGENTQVGQPGTPLPKTPRYVALLPVHPGDDEAPQLQLTLDRGNRVPIRIEGLSRQAKELTVRIVVNADGWQYYTEGSLLGGEEGLSNAHWTAADACTIEGVPQGDAVLVILSDMYRGCVKLAADAPGRVVRIDPGETGAVNGRVRIRSSQNALPGAPVYVKASALTGGPVFHAHGERHGFSGRFQVVAAGVTNEAGTFRIDNLAQGTYWIGLRPVASSPERLVKVCADDYPWADWEGWVGLARAANPSVFPPRPASTTSAAPPPPPTELSTWAFWNTMSDDERIQYLARSVKLATHRRLLYPQGNEAYVRVEYRFTLPRDWRQPEPEVVIRHYVDGESYGRPSKYEGNAASASDLVPGLLDLGTHSYHWTLGYRLQHEDKRVSSVLTSDTYTFKVVSADTPDHLVAPSDPELDRKVRAAFQIAGTLAVGTYRGTSSLKPGSQWALTEPLPVDLCCDVEVHVLETGEVHRGFPIVTLKGTTESDSFIVRGTTGVPWPAKDDKVALRIVLKPSRSLALSRPEVTHYYGGTIASDVIEAPVHTRPKPAS